MSPDERIKELEAALLELLLVNEKEQAAIKFLDSKGFAYDAERKIWAGPANDEQKLKNAADNSAKSRFIGDNKSGGQVTYYSVDVPEPSKGGPPVHVEAIDVIAALDMTFAEGEAFKSIWRCAADRHGLQKQGNETVRDAEKVVYYGQQMIRREKLRKA